MKDVPEQTRFLPHILIHLNFTSKTSGITMKKIGPDIGITISFKIVGKSIFLQFTGDNIIEKTIGYHGIEFKHEYVFVYFDSGSEYQCIGLFPSTKEERVIFEKCTEFLCVRANNQELIFLLTEIPAFSSEVDGIHSEAKRE